MFSLEPEMARTCAPALPSTQSRLHIGRHAAGDSACEHARGQFHGDRTVDGEGVTGKYANTIVIPGFCATVTANGMDVSK